MSHRDTDNIDRDDSGNLNKDYTVTDVSFSSQGNFIVTASAYHTARVWSTSGELLHTLEGHTDIVRGVAISPDGNRIVTVSADATARLWSKSGELLLTYVNKETPAGGALSAAIFRPDGKQVAIISDDNIVRLWDLSTDTVTLLLGHDEEIRAVSYSHDGKLIATASNDDTARLWTTDGVEIASLRGHVDDVKDVIFSFDGKYIITASDDSTIRFHLVRTEDLLAATACRVERVLSEQEKATYKITTTFLELSKRQCRQDQ